MALNIRIDRASCLGNGLCADLLPTVFALDDEDTAVVVAVAGPTDEDAVRQAARACPTRAIHIDED